VIYLTLNN